MSSRLLRTLAIVPAVVAAVACGNGAHRGVIHASGHIEATEIRLAAKVGGTLLALPFWEGDKVKAGEVVARLDRIDAEHSLARPEEGRWTLKFDRESFFGGDGILAMETIEAIRMPTLLVRAEHSRIMTAEAAEHARERNLHARLVTIAGAHHHVLLEDPEAVARTITEFVASLV